MLQRSCSAGRLALPQPREAFARRLQDLQGHTRLLFSNESRRPISTASPSQPNRFLRTSLQRKRPLAELENELERNRPLTQSMPKRTKSPPLTVVKARTGDWQSRQVRSNFLRKGSSIDRAILSNVLRSKLNAVVSPSTCSYGDAPANHSLIRLVRGQIPRGMKDVVGAEEMMRMSHIMTGVRFQTLSLTRRVATALQQTRAHSQQPEEQDALTLKSIKRW